MSAAALVGVRAFARQPALARSALRSLAVQARSNSTSAPASTTPGYVAGGPIPRDSVNDALPFPAASRTHGSYHWAFERVLSAALVPATVGAFVVSPSAYPALDALLGVTLVMHSHIGFDSLLVDYVHPRKYGALGKALPWVLRATTASVLLGVYQFNTNDIGITELITKVWTA